MRSKAAHNCAGEERADHERSPDRHAADDESACKSKPSRIRPLSAVAFTVCPLASPKWVHSPGPLLCPCYWAEPGCAR
jgi:hypothetical protein